jgi:SET domain
VYQLWQEQQASDAVEPVLSLQEIAEESLLNECQRLLEQEMESATARDHDDPNSSRTAAVHRSRCLEHCLSALEGIHQVTSQSVPSLACLLCLEDTMTRPTTSTTTSTKTALTSEELRQIIRRNAFGPDFITLESMQRKWQAAALTETAVSSANVTLSSSSHEATNLPPRILGLYPLAAMINHSCWPNAVRVYGQWPGTASLASSSSSFHPSECMVVHASHDIMAGDEVVWSYIPPVQAVCQRRTILQSTHGFWCTCPRCTLELATEPTLPGPLGPEIISQPPNHHNDDSITQAVQGDALLDRLEQLDVAERVPFLENVWASTTWSNEQKRYGRVSYLSYYIHHFNTTTTLCGNEWNESAESTLTLAMHVHLALAASHNASTEHLSVRKQAHVSAYASARSNDWDYRR